ncbi:MAG TPA: hypothetical protein PLD87_11835 [Bacteroidia bacterium]|nr:hypothetical protein [Bacteroidia bacterium]
MSKGILIFAYSHPFYGMYAANLAASIKFTCPDIPITLLHDEKAIGHFNAIHRSLFNEFKEIPKDCFYTNGVFQPYKAKLYAYELSPYDETIFIDADVIMFPLGRNLNNIFEELKDVDFTIQNRSNYDAATDIKPDMWADLQEIKKEYSVTDGQFYYISSEFIYFKKTEQNEKLFKDAINIFDNFRITYKRFGGGIPDELPLSIAMLVNKVKPHADGYRPIYWEAAEKKNYNTIKLYGSQRTENYIGYSAGGYIASNNRMKEVYNTLAQFYAAKYGFTPSPFREKRTFNKDRANI